MSYGFRVRLAMLALVAMPTVTVAQSLGDSLARRSIDVELLGPGGFSSINYQHRIARQTYARVGFGRWSVSTFLLNSGHHRGTLGIAGVSRLFDLSRLPGQRGTWIETGLNTGIGKRSFDDFNGRESGPWMSINAEAGFRLQDPGRNLSMRILAGPSYIVRSSLSYPRPGFTRGAALSLGVAF